MIKKICHTHSKLSIDTSGGKIEELVLDGVKVLGTYDRVDGKKGSTHICTPNFAGEGMTEYGLPFHGPARNLEWEVVKESESSLEIRLVLEALGKYETRLEVKQLFTIDSSLRHAQVKPNQNDSSQTQVILGQRSGDLYTSPTKTHTDNVSFHHEVIVKNIGDKSMPVNIGIHNYFDTPNGWENAQLNGRNIKAEIEKNLSMRIINNVGDKQTNWSLVFAPLERDRGTGIAYRIATQGVREMVTWSAKKDDKYDSEYACVEPVCWFDPSLFGTEASLLHPGEIRALKQTISIS